MPRLSSRLRFWFPVIACYVLILFFSLIHIPKRTFHRFPFLDKIAHLTEFAILGYFMGRAVLREHSKIILIFSVIFLSGFEELLQFLTKDRTPDWSDFLVNIIGAAVGIWIFYLTTRRTHDSSLS